MNSLTLNSLASEFRIAAQSRNHLGRMTHDSLHFTAENILTEVASIVERVGRQALVVEGCAASEALGKIERAFDFMEAYISYVKDHNRKFHEEANGIPNTDALIAEGRAALKELKS